MYGIDMEWVENLIDIRANTNKSNIMDICPNCQGTEIEVDPFWDEVLCLKCGAVVRERVDAWRGR